MPGVGSAVAVCALLAAEVVDRSFVAGVECNADDRAIVRATIDMAHAVGLTVVAEGVETREQEQQLRAFGCTAFRGICTHDPNHRRR